MGKVKRKMPKLEIVETLDKLRAFKEFETVSIAPDGTVSVKFLPRFEKNFKKGKTVETAIDSLRLKPPIFNFNGENTE